MRKRRYYIYIIIGLLLIVALSFYVWHYHYGFSNNVNDWSAFGNYFSGIMMPFLTIANIIVFIELTIAISDFESKRSTKEMEQQKALLIMQFRRQSIESFYQHINPLFEENIEGDLEKMYAEAIEYLQKFLNVDYKYFDCDENSFTERNIRHLLTKLNIIHLDISLKKQFNSEQFLKSIDVKNEIINSLIRLTLETNNDKEQ